MKKIYQILLLFCSIFIFGPNSSTAQNLESDSLALVDLYTNCGGANWTGYDMWLNGPINTWEGVTVDSALQRVTHISFKEMDLVGTLPESLGGLNEMSGKIELHDDPGMTGELPSLVWKWTKVDRFQLKRTGITSIDLTGIENMVNLTEYNTEANNIGGAVPGVIFTLPSMVKAYFHNCKYDGLPAEMSNATGMDRLYLNGNNLTELPDLSNAVWADGAKIRVHDNNLTFEDLEGNVSLSSVEAVEEFRYSPQAAVGVETYQYPDAGSMVTLTSGVEGSDNIYTWIKNGTEPVGSEADLTIDAFDAATNSGSYSVVVQSALVPGLDIFGAPQKLFASSNAQDSLALVALYNGNGGSEWVGYDTWLNGPLSTWEGVTLDSASQRVINVNFKDMDIVGTLVQDVGDLTEMSGKVEFRDDALMTGEFPAVVWKWTKLERFQLKFSGVTSIDLTGMENMVNLTEYNTEGNAIGGAIPGVIFTLPSMVKAFLHECEYTSLPPEVVNASGLDRLYVNGNNLTDIPDLSGVGWVNSAKVRVHDNNLTFEDLEANVVIPDNPEVEEFRYSPQAVVGAESYQYPDAGSAVTFTSDVGGSDNLYTWIKNGTEPVGSEADFTIDAFDAATNSGSYSAVVQSALVPGLDIFVAPQKIFASENAQDSLALVALYNGNGGSEWVGYDTWLNGPLSTWEGVTIDSASQRVINVNFKDMDIVGTLVQDVGDLTEMSGKVEFRDDALMTGEFPAVVWKWTKLERFQLKFSGVTSIDLTGMENMVNLTEYNTEGNAIGGAIPGVIFTLPSMVKAFLHECEYTSLPAEVVNASGLDRLYVNGNNLTDIPDLTGVGWVNSAKVRVHDNNLTFEDLEANVVIPDNPEVEEFRYSPQAVVGEVSYQYPDAGSTVTFTSDVGGSDNLYTWIKGGTEVVGSEADFTIDAFDAATNSGRYSAVVQSGLVPGLDIFVADQKLFSSVQAQDSLALVALFNTNGGVNWEGFDTTSTWFNGPLSTWEGVTVDSASQRVVNVNFKDMDIMGTLVQDLEDITEMGGKIEFRDDSLMVGELPAFIWKWTNLERFQLKFSGITSVDLTGMENMVNLTEYNTEGNAIGGTIPGVIFTLPSMVKAFLHECEYTALPSEVVNATGLDRLYVNGNNLTDIPDLTGIGWVNSAKVRVHDNNLTFEDLEANVVIPDNPEVEEFRYSPQANVGEPTLIEAISGDMVTMDVPVGGSANIYTWVKNENEPVSDESVYSIESVSVDDVGKYFLLVQSALVPGLDIMSEEIVLTVDGVNSIKGLDHFGDINVLGNPVQNTLSIQADVVIERVRVQNMNGQLMNDQLVNSQQVNLPVSDLAPGLYLVTLQSEGQFYTLKVMKN